MDSKAVNIIVLASNNTNKIAEFKRILDGFSVEIRSLSEFGPIPEAIEDGETFDENAYKKAHHVARILGLPAIADDSGLVVNALGGEPGVRSARYAGDGATDDENIDKLLCELNERIDRTAHFQCVLSIAVPLGPALTYEGRCDGTITRERRGSKGFGYDPVFYTEEYGKTFAELSMDDKNKISHRGRALAEFQAEVDKVLRWLELRMEEEKPQKPDHDQYLDNDWSDQ